jgi:hypothetical protein
MADEKGSTPKKVVEATRTIIMKNWPTLLFTGILVGAFYWLYQQKECHSYYR